MVVFDCGPLNKQRTQTSNQKNFKELRKTSKSFLRKEQTKCTFDSYSAAGTEKRTPAFLQFWVSTLFNTQKRVVTAE